MKSLEFIKQIIAGKIVDMKNAADFLDAVKICRKKYGRKSVLFADISHQIHCIVLIVKESPTGEKIGRFTLGLGKVREYCIANKIPWIGFNELLLGKTEFKKRMLDTSFVIAKDKFIDRITSSYRKSSLYDKKRIIEHLKQVKV